MKPKILKDAKTYLRERKRLKDSINSLKKKIMDMNEFSDPDKKDLTASGVKSIANALLARKKEIDQTTNFADLRDIAIDVFKSFDTTAGRRMLIEVDKMNNYYKRDPKPGSQVDYRCWEKLMRYLYNIILKASGNPSPDARPNVSEKEVKEELGHMMKKHDSVCKDEEDEILEACRAIGLAHDKLIEAMDLVESLENEGKISSSLRYALEDVEAPLSELDFMGESNPKEVMLEKFSEEGFETWDDDEDYDL